MSLIYTTLDKQSYLDYHNGLEGKDAKFSKVAIGMWDFMKAWDNWHPRILKDGEEVVSACFMKVSSQAQSKTLFISNIFTPLAHRGKGYARNMLDCNIKEALEEGATSIRMDCNRTALGFYDKLGFTYWGTTIGESMFFDMPLDPKGSGVSFFETLKNVSSADILNMYNPKLRLAKIKWIARKVKKHEEFDYGHPSRYSEFMEIYNNEKL